jgi:hypothetical protein
MCAEGGVDGRLWAAVEGYVELCEMCLRGKVEKGCCDYMVSLVWERWDIPRRWC